MTAPARRAVALLVADRAQHTADARLLLEVLGLIDGPDARELAADPEGLPVMSAHDRVGHDVVLAGLPGRGSTVPAGLRSAATSAPAPSAPSPSVPAPAVASVAPRSGRQPARCGTRSGYDRHLRQQEPTCQPCRDAQAAYGRARAAAQPPKPAQRLMPCGTVAAYLRHQRSGETPCLACRTAQATYHRDRRSARRDATS